MNKFNTAPAFKFVVFLSIGILIGKYFLLPFFVSVPFLLFILLLFLFINDKYNSTKSVIFLLAIIIIGFIKSNYDFESSNSKSVNFLNQNLSRVFLTGVIENLPEYGKNKIRFTVDADEIISRNDTLGIDGRILVILKQNKILTASDSIPELNPGDKVIMFGSLRDAPEETNPGDFNYKNYLALNDINKIFKVDFYSDVEVLSNHNLNFFEQNIILPARKYAINNINSLVGGEEAAYLNGLVTGYRADFSKELKEDFVKAGVMHLIAVSGLNVAYIIIFLTVTFSLLRIPLNIKIYLFIFALIFYSLFTGGTASIVRAVIMGSVLILNYKVQRKINFYNVIGVSALIILMYDSRQLFDAGFILSYSAVLSIVIIFGKVDSILGKKIEHWAKDWRKIFYFGYITLLTTISAQIGVLPVTINYFGKISVVGLFTNIIAIPLSNISLALGFVQVIAGIFSEFISSLIAEVNSYLLHYQIYFIKWSAALKWSYFEIYGFSVWLLLTFYIVLLLILASSNSNYKLTIIASLAVISLYLTFSNIRSDTITVNYLSLGNSDCTHIETPDGSNILIDVGTENQYNNSASSRIVPYLKRKNVKDIDLLVLTSVIGKNQKAVNTILDNFYVRRIAIPDKEELSGNLENKIIGNKIIVDEIKNIDNIRGFGGLNFVFLKNNIDSAGLLLKVVYNQKSFLFAGKTETSQENGFVKKYDSSLKSSVIKIAKNGSEKSSSLEFLSKVNPEIAVISASFSEERNLPSPVIISRLQSLKSKIYSTYELGAVILKSDGYSIDFK